MGDFGRKEAAYLRDFRRLVRHHAMSIHQRQTPPSSSETFVSGPVTCESLAALIDNAVIESQKHSATVLIFINRLGRNERSGLSKSRLKAINTYLSRYKSIKYGTAEGAKTQRLGRMEFYVGGKFKNRSLSVEKFS